MLYKNNIRCYLYMPYIFNYSILGPHYTPMGTSTIRPFGYLSRMMALFATLIIYGNRVGSLDVRQGDGIVPGRNWHLGCLFSTQSLKVVCYKWTDGSPDFCDAIAPLHGDNRIVQRAWQTGAIWYLVGIVKSSLAVKRLLWGQSGKMRVASKVIRSSMNLRINKAQRHVLAYPLNWFYRILCRIGW